jgi:hypothetical protein
MQNPPARTRLSPLCTLRLEVFDMKVGAPAADGISIFGSIRGSVEGERLAGTVVSPSNEWARGTTQGGVSTDCHLLIETTDGALVSVHYQGVSSNGHAAAAFQFHTGTETYAWLNTVVAVGAGIVDMSGPTVEYDVQVCESG